MMTLERLRALADSYGGDLQRWPQRLRPQARGLLESSADARDIIAAASDLDDAIVAASTARSDSIWSADRPEAALVRLRNDVAARIRPAGGAGAIARRKVPRHVGWLSLATAASVAIVAGVTLGIRYSPVTQQQDLLALLQPAPVQLLND